MRIFNGKEYFDGNGKKKIFRGKEYVFDGSIKNSNADEPMKILSNKEYVINKNLKNGFFKIDSKKENLKEYLKNNLRENNNIAKRNFKNGSLNSKVNVKIFKGKEYSLKDFKGKNFVDKGNLKNGSEYFKEKQNLGINRDKHLKGKFYLFNDKTNLIRDKSYFSKLEDQKTDDDSEEENFTTLIGNNIKEN